MLKFVILTACLLTCRVYAQSSCPKCGEPKRCRKFVNKNPTSDLDAFYEEASIFFNNNQGDDLRDELNTKTTEGHRNLGYACVWSALAITDADPMNEDNVMLFYSQESMPRLCRVCREKDDDDNWNREHLWPTSRGFDSKGRFEHNDIHHLVPTDKSINGGGRSDRDFGEGGANFTEGEKARACDGCKFTGSQQNGTWEPPDAVKGQVARMMFYMDIRYNTLDLVPEKIAKKNGKLGNLVTLLKWHCDNDVTDKEKSRNDKVEELQGNRNPFIDRPEFAKVIWPQYSDSIWSNGCKWEKDDEPRDRPLSIWINELHYDNSGRDRDEFVEIACNQRVRLAGYKIILINGSTRDDYKTINLSETCSPDSNFVVRSDVSPMQNGGSDGVVLVQPDGDIIEFVSYEGTTTYKGRESDDIGVAESNNTPIGFSLQKFGSGCSGDDFKWRQEALDSSKGRVNVGQTINCDGFRDEL